MTTRAIDIKNYLSDLFVHEDALLSSIKERARQQGLPNIEVPSTVGKLLYCLAKIQKPQKILEIGTLAGYSTIWLGRALPDNGILISLELDPHHVAIARNNISLVHLEHKIEIREGNAKELLDLMIDNNEGPFDLIFIDADKENYPCYLEKALKLSRLGTLILSDNLIPKGDTIGKPHPNHPEAKDIYEFNEKIASHPLLESILATTIVGDLGRIDALGISIVNQIL